MKEGEILKESIAEYVGTFVFMLFGMGCVAGLIVSGANYGQWEISVIWGLAVTTGIYISAGVSGAHLNPAVTLALTTFKNFERKKVVPFIIAQTLGAFSAAAIVYYMYSGLFRGYEKAHGILRGSVASLKTASVFSTYPHPMLTGNIQAFMIELIITAILMMAILAITDDKNGGINGVLGPLLIGIVVAVIGASIGPLTGFALNPARDFGPKVFAFLAGWGKVAFTGGLSNPYFWVPILGPTVGAQLGSWIYVKFIESYFVKIEEK